MLSTKIFSDVTHYYNNATCSLEPNIQFHSPQRGETERIKILCENNHQFRNY